MSSGAEVSRRTEGWSARMRVFLRAVPRRLHERGFWMIQAQVLAVTLLHLLAETFPSHSRPDSLELLHLPVVLYAIPITYAGFIYGVEGATLTCLWSAILVVPNVLHFHRVPGDATGDAIFMAVVGILGLLVAIPVDRERLERQRAEATSRRLALANEVADALSRPRNISSTLDLALARVTEVVGLDAACVVLQGDPGDREVRVPFPRNSADAEALMGVAAGAVSGPSIPQPAAIRERSATFPMMAGHRAVGCLAVLLPQGRPPLGQEDRELLAAAASEIRTATDNHRLRERERERLESYARQVTQAQEDERLRIARELHDGTAQALVVLGRDLDELSQEPDGLPADVRERLGQLRSTAADALGDLRRFSRDLRPMALDDLGLIAALEWLVSDMGSRTGMDAGLHVSGAVRRLPPEVEVASFRITQEALRNVERHAHAGSVQVEVVFDGDLVRVTVEDDGRGFEAIPAERLAEQGHLGVLGMEERAHLLGGKLAIDSRLGEGTRVIAEVRVDARGS